MRSSKGQFLPGHTPTPEEKAAILIATKEAWKKRDNYSGGLVGTKFHNAWRSFRFTLKGKRIGCSKEWEQFNTFKNDMMPSYVEGYSLIRRDKTKPFSKENCLWVPKGVRSAYMSSNLRTISFAGETKTLRQWALDLNISLVGLQQRYHAKGYSVEEMLFGKLKIKKVPLPENKIRVRASKLISTYRIKDKNRGYPPYELDKDWFIENILLKTCSYCGSIDRIGADRLDNSIGHDINNIIPCCHLCNAIRGDKFSVSEMKMIGETIYKIRSQRL